MGETSWWAAREAAASIVQAAPACSVRVTDALRRTLAADVRARVDLPSFPTAAMDGWVVAGDAPWTVVGTIDTGVPPTRELQPGQAMRIATGGLVPPGADAVIPWEIADMAGDSLVAHVPDKVHIRPAGEECVRGDVLALRGEEVNPALVGLMSAAGVDHVDVFEVPRVGILVLGDEVMTAGLPGPGHVRDALGVQLPGWITALGGEVCSLRSVVDDQTALVAALNEAVAESDVVVATGGTARGHRDFLRTALEEAGSEFIVDGVAVRPGHPMMLARHGTTPVVGLPGNPLSALVALVTIVAPIVDRWLGRSGVELAQVQMAEAIGPARKELTRLMVGRRELGGFRQVSHVSSAMLRGISHADGWAVIPSAGVGAGDVVPWIPVPWTRRG